MDDDRPGEEELPDALVEGLNVGLASGRWEEVLDLFADHATLTVDRGSRTSFEGPEGIRDALEGLREEFPGARYASHPAPEEGDDPAWSVVSDLLAASGPDAPEGRVRLDLTPGGEVREALFEVPLDEADGPG